MNVCVFLYFSVGLTEILSINTDTNRSVCLLYTIFVSVFVVGLRPMTPVPCVWQAGLYSSLHLYEYAWPPGFLDMAV